MELWNFKGKQSFITEALQLDLPEHAVIAVTGAGGKTSLIFAWANELAESGKRTVITTTTHMADPADSASGTAGFYEGITVVFADPGDAIKEVCHKIDAALSIGSIVLAVSHDPDMPGKVKALPSEVMHHIFSTSDAVLIEADGSRRKPLKWPADWEPVVPDCADVTVCVAGMSSLGCTTSDVMYRHEYMPQGMRRDIVDEQMLFAAVSSLNGGRKGVRGEYRVFMNQADSLPARSSAAAIQKMFAVCGIQSAWGSFLPESSCDDGSEIRIALILEAAGNSVRFGSNKLLFVMSDGLTMAEHAINAAKAVEGCKKILVTQYDEIAALAPEFETVINDQPDLGISHSMQLGIKAARDADAYMFCVCDQPWLKTTTLRKLIEAYKNGTAGIVSLSWQGELRNPKIFSSRYRNELLSLSGDTGGRQIISAHPDDIALIEADSEDETIDIDCRP